MFRATWLTSVFAGATIGMAAEFTEIRHLPSYWIAPVFFIGMFCCVMGIPQMMELRALQKRRGSFSIPAREEFTEHYFPAWGRMFIAFVSAATGGIIMHTFK